MTNQEMFEAWVKEVCPQIQWELTAKTDGDYDSGAMSWAWAAWQAAQQREGYKLVPVEPTKEMLRELSGNDMNGRIIYKALIGAAP